MGDLEQLARFRVACETGHLPEDLGRWALEQLQGRLPAAERVRVRDTTIRAAAALMTGTRSAKSQRLAIRFRLTARHVRRILGACSKK